MTVSPTSILEQSKDLYSKKEEDYGESWKLTGTILSEIIKQQGKEEITIPAEPEYLIAFGLYTRRLDKLVRSFNGTFMKEDMEVDESVGETVSDQVPYAAMQATIAKTLNEETDGGTDYEYCSECGDVAADRITLNLDGDSEENNGNWEYEYFCECGNVWWGN